MPTPYLDKISQEYGVAMSDLERYWDEAKLERSRIQKKSVKKFRDPDWAYVTGVVNKRVGVKENLSTAEHSQIEYLLSKQMNDEFYSGYLYFAMSAWCRGAGLVNIADYFSEAGLEELDHGYMFEDYILSRGYAIDYGIEMASIEPTKRWGSLNEILVEALQHEEEVTNSIELIFSEARNSNDYQTEQFLLWFLEEQIEEEEKFRVLINAHERSGFDDYAINSDIFELGG